MKADRRKVVARHIAMASRASNNANPFLLFIDEV
jgi:hypothetical protein